MSLLNNSFPKESNTVFQTNISDASDDCANKHVTHQPKPIQVNNHYSEPKDSTKKKIINIKDFTPNDLQLFVDSLETIERLKKVKYERRQNSNTKQLRESFENSKKTVNCWDASMIFTSYDEDAYCETSHYIHNKTQYPLPDKSSSKATLYIQESEELGIYLNNDHKYHIYEQIDFKHVHSKDHSHYKSKALLSPSRSFGENVEYCEIYERILAEVPPQLVKKSKKARKRHRPIKKRRENASTTQQKFLNRAMRFLSL